MYIQSGLIPFLEVIKSRVDLERKDIFRIEFGDKFESDDVNVVPFVESIEGVSMPAMELIKIDAKGFTFLINDLLNEIQKSMPPALREITEDMKIGYIASPMDLYPEVHA